MLQEYEKKCICHSLVRFVIKLDSSLDSINVGKGVNFTKNKKPYHSEKSVLTWLS
ncbi:hypothetical protein GCM10022292_07270 [Winogradskyella damuponensis]|uniref:Uncharacterized protein n=1 Tax=Winogradskyella damuponensis TaxID=943939 RepID=A0ABP8CNL2_9FLAO